MAIILMGLSWPGAMASITSLTNAFWFGPEKDIKYTFFGLLAAIILNTLAYSALARDKEEPNAQTTLGVLVAAVAVFLTTFLVPDDWKIANTYFQGIVGTHFQDIIGTEEFVDMTTFLSDIITVAAGSIVIAWVIFALFSKNDEVVFTTLVVVGLITFFAWREDFSPVFCGVFLVSALGVIECLLLWFAQGVFGKTGATETFGGPNKK